MAFKKKITARRGVPGERLQQFTVWLVPTGPGRRPSKLSGCDFSGGTLLSHWGGPFLPKSVPKRFCYVLWSHLGSRRNCPNPSFPSPKLQLFLASWALLSPVPPARSFSFSIFTSTCCRLSCLGEKFKLTSAKFHATFLILMRCFRHSDPFHCTFREETVVEKTLGDEFPVLPKSLDTDKVPGTVEAVGSSALDL